MPGDNHHDTDTFRSVCFRAFVMDLYVKLQVCWAVWKCTNTHMSELCAISKDAVVLGPMHKVCIVRGQTQPPAHERALSVRYMRGCVYMCDGQRIGPFSYTGQGR